ncbi:MAG: FecR domain-containing protein [Bacteroidota bacterium]
MSADDWTRIDDYLRGDPSPEEQAAFEAWLSEDPERRTAFEQLRGLRAWGQAERYDVPEEEVEDDWAAIRSRIDRSDGDGHRSRSAPARPAVSADRAPRQATRRPARRIRPLPVALATALVAAGAWLATASLRTGDAPGPRTWATGPTQSATVPLADGSRVVLASGTTLTRTDPTSRDYVLTGAARFEVARDEARPFTVETEHGMARVLGTVFTVSAAVDADSMAVSVEEGRVAVRSSGSAGEVVLVTGEVASARVDRAPVLVAAAVPEVAAVPDAVDSSPAVGVSLRFDGAPLAAVAAALSQVHGVTVEVEGAEAARLPVTADYTGVSLDDAVESLDAILDLTVETRGSRITLSQTLPDVR